MIYYISKMNNNTGKNFENDYDFKIQDSES